MSCLCWGNFFRTKPVPRGTKSYNFLGGGLSQPSWRIVVKLYHFPSGKNKMLKTFTYLWHIETMHEDSQIEGWHMVYETDNWLEYTLDSDHLEFSVKQVIILMVSHT